MHQKFRLTLCASMFAALVACGGGSSSTSPVGSTVTGVAATGLAISGGAVTLKCVSGTATYPSTGTDGSFSIDVSNVTLPCVARVDYKDSGGVAQKLHSFVSAAGNANITPVTDLMVASLTGGASANAFDSFDTTKTKAITAAQVSDAVAKTKAYLVGLGVTATAMMDDPVGTKFTPKIGTSAGDANDQMLDAVKTKLGSKTIETAETEVPHAVAGTTGSTSSSNTSSTACSGTNLIFTGSATGGPVKSGDAICFTTATATNLAFTLPRGSITLSNPSKDSGGFTLFTDTNSHFAYEVIFESNKLMEINVVDTATNNTYVGQFAPDPAVACPAKGGTAIPAGQAMGGTCKMPQTTQVACAAAGFNFEPVGSICWANP